MKNNSAIMREILKWHITNTPFCDLIIIPKNKTGMKKRAIATLYNKTE